MAGKKAGWRAPLWGAICGTIPDLDVISGGFMHVVDSNAFHRTITHSILFFVIMAPLLGYLIRRIHSSGMAGWRDWTWLAFWSLFTHALLDCFTTWGTALFWPFSYKVAFQSIFVIDPLYTLPLLVFTVLAIRQPRTSGKRYRYAWTGLAVSSAYLLLSLWAKLAVTGTFRDALDRQEISYSRLETRPAPLNIILWGVTVETNEGYYTGYHSLLENNDRIEFIYYPKNHEWLDPFLTSERVQVLTRLTNGWYTVENRETEGEGEAEGVGGGNGLVVNDLRFGTNRAWEAGGSFIFSYEISENAAGQTIIRQKDREFEDPPSVILSKLARRIIGNEKTSSL